MRFVVVWYDIATTRNQDSFDSVYIDERNNIHCEKRDEEGRTTESLTIRTWVSIEMVG